jgi:hypothetical protein
VAIARHSLSISILSAGEAHVDSRKHIATASLVVSCCDRAGELDKDRARVVEAKISFKYFFMIQKS